MKTAKAKIFKTQKNYDHIISDLIKQNTESNKILWFIYSIRGEDIEQNIQRGESKLIEFSKEREKLYIEAKKHQADLSHDEFIETCDKLIEIIANNSKPINDMYRAFYADVTSEDLCKPNSDGTPKKSKIAPVVKLFRVWEILPTFEFTKNKRAYIKSYIYNAINRYKSWVECDIETVKNYNHHKTLVDSVLESMDKCNCKSIFVEMVDDLGNVFDATDDQNYRYFGKRFLEFYKQILLPSFRTGNVVYSGKIKLGRDHQDFSANEKIVDTLFKYNPLWEEREINEKTVDLFSEHYSFFESLNYLKTKKKRSGFTLFSKTSPSALHFGNNFIPFNLKQEENNRSFLTVSTKEYDLEVVYRSKKVKFSKTDEKTIENKCYLDNLQVSSKKSGIFDFEFDVNKKYHNVTVLREPEIMMTRGELYFSMPLNDIVENPRWDNIKDLNTIGYYFATNHFNKYKHEAKAKELIKDKTIRVMGVDTGFKPFYAYSIFEYLNGDITDTKINGKYSGEYKSRYNEVRAMRSLITVIRNVGKYIKNDEQFKDEWFSRLNMDKDELVKELDKFETIREYKSNKSTLVRNEIKRFKQIIGKIKDDSFKSDSPDITNVFDTVKFIDTYKSLIYSWNTLGETKDTKTSPNMNFGDSHLSNYRDNLKDNMLKTIAHNLVMTAKENNVDIIVVENFSGESRLATRKDNAFKALFAPCQIQEKFTEVAEREGIFCIGIDKTNTSKVVHGKNVFGYRDKVNKEKLIWLDNGEISWCDSDINAAKNIAFKYLSKNKTPYTVYLKGDGKNFIGDRDKTARFKLKDGRFISGKIKPKSMKETLKVFLHRGSYINFDDNKKYVAECELAANTKP